MLSEFTRRARTARGIVDVGANAGLYTYHAAAAAAPHVPIIAIEAIAELAAVINENLLLNCRANARALNCAASDEDRDVTFYVAISDQVSSLDAAHVEFHDGLAGSPRQVRATTIDRVLQKMPHVDLMKIDVEGHELEALTGAQETLRRHHPALLLEAKRDTAEAVRVMLSGFGYRIRRLEAKGWAEVGRVMVPGDHLLANFLCEHVRA